METNLNGLTPGSTVIRSLWGDVLPTRVVGMLPPGRNSKYITLKDDNGNDVPLTDTLIALHLQGEQTYAAPLIDCTGMARAFVIELDVGGMQTAQRVLQALQVAGLTAFSTAVKGSGDHDGSHTFVLYEHAWKPERLREQSRRILNVLNIQTTEIYPNGCNIRLPFGYHLHSESRGRLLLQTGEIFNLDDTDELHAALIAVSMLPKNTTEPPEPPAKPVRVASHRTTDHPTDDRYAQAVIDAELETLAGCQNGSRNTTLFKVARRINEFYLASRVSADVFDTIETLALNIGLERSEVRATLKSARNGGTPEESGKPGTQHDKSSNKNSKSSRRVVSESSTVLPHTDAVKLPRVVRVVRVAEKKNFPLDVLPPVLRNMVQAVAAASETHPDAAALYSLAVLSACVGGKARISMQRGWEENLCVYVLLVMESGEGKSTLLRYLSSRLLEREKSLIADWKAAKRAYDEAKKDDVDLVHPGAKPRIVTRNFTPEELEHLMRENGERMAVLTAEGGFLDILAGRYSKDTTADIDLLLSGWTGETVSNDRRSNRNKGEPPDPLYDPVLTIGAMVQPITLERLKNQEVLQARGFFGRFMVAHPPSLVGKRQHTNPEVPEQVELDYNAFLDKLLSTTDSNTIPVMPEALKAIQAYARQIEPLRTSEYKHIRDFVDKDKAHLARIATLLMIADNPHKRLGSVPVSKEYVDRAIRIFEYCIPQVQTMRYESSEQGRVDTMIYRVSEVVVQHAQKWIDDCGAVRFTLTQVRRYLNANKDDMPILHQALTTLAESGALTELESKRRDSRMFEAYSLSDFSTTLTTLTTLDDISHCNAENDSSNDYYSSTTLHYSSTTVESAQPEPAQPAQPVQPVPAKRYDTDRPIPRQGASLPRVTLASIKAREIKELDGLLTDGGDE